MACGEDAVRVRVRAGSDAARVRRGRGCGCGLGFGVGVVDHRSKGVGSGKGLGCQGEGSGFIVGVLLLWGFIVGWPGSRFLQGSGFHRVRVDDGRDVLRLGLAEGG